jgi:hypothetical protein
MARGSLRSRVLLVAAAAANALALPLTGLLLLPVVGPVNPMLTAFLVDFEIRNRSGETVWVTPVAATGTPGERVLLPLFDRRWPARIAPSNRDLEVPAGASIRLTYDWDDCQFSEVLVRRASGDLRQVTVDPLGDRPVADFTAGPELVDLGDPDALPAAEPRALAPLLPNRPAPAAPPPLGLLLLGPLVHLGTAAGALLAMKRERDGRLGR